MSAPELTEHERLVVAVHQSTAQARAVLLQAAMIAGPEVADLFAALIRAAILVTAAHPHAVDVLKVGVDMLAQARVQVGARRPRTEPTS